MTNIAITEMGPGRFGVEIEEGHERTGHVITVPDGFADQLGLVDIDDRLLVRESVGFLLDRDLATSIGERLSLDEIGIRYADYHDELRARLGET